VIGISLLTLKPGISGGSETYARSLTHALAQVGELEYQVFLPRSALDAGDGLPSQVARSYPASRGTLVRIAAMGLATAYPGRLRRELELERLEAIHYPLSVMLPRVGKRLPVATSVHDLQHELFPRFFSRARLVYRRAVMGRAIARSRFVITFSDYSAQVLRERKGLAPERVRVIPHGIDHDLFTPSGEKREPFLLYPANRWPHKNHERLFEAFALLRRENPELRLVLTGSLHEGKPIPDGVEVRGHVSMEELVSLYRRAACLVFPSLYEGFGQPPLEAMACGCPVAVSHVASLPEVCGDAARYFDPTSPEEIATAVSDALSHPDELVSAGIARAALFTWEECARRHEAVYRELAGS